jgi:hypothetical protein
VLLEYGGLRVVQSIKLTLIFDQERRSPYSQH